MNEALVPVLGPSEARRLTNEVKRDAEALWRKLVELYEGGAHTALGYLSWDAYCAAEFDVGRSHSYRLLEAGRVAKAIPPRGTENGLPSRASHRSTDTGLPINERQARELAPLLRDEDEDAVAEVWHEIRTEHGEDLTAEKVRTAVEKRLAPNRQRVADLRRSPSALEKDFQKAVTDALNALGWRWYHSRPAQTSKGWRTALSGDAGYPDITAVRRGRIIFIELKAEKGRLSEEQGVWLADLGAAGAEAFCWRPSDWPAIEAALQ
jgi:hypothetical protein